MKSMPVSRTRRIIRRAVMALAVVVLLVTGNSTRVGQPPMPATRRRRIVRRAVMALGIFVAVPVSLLAWYVSAWMLFTRVATPVARPANPYLEHIVAHPAFGPIEAHIVAERPGTDLLVWLHEIADPN